MKIECLFMEESPDINFPYNMVTADGINSIINKKIIVPKAQSCKGVGCYNREYDEDNDCVRYKANIGGIQWEATHILYYNEIQFKMVYPKCQHELTYGKIPHDDEARYFPTDVEVPAIPAAFAILIAQDILEQNGKDKGEE